METNDGGETWNPFKNPPDALPGEAAFAASGTCLRVEKGLTLLQYCNWVGTSRAYALQNLMRLMQTAGTNICKIFPINLWQNLVKGAFSFVNGNNGLVVCRRGDYSNDNITDCRFSIAEYTMIEHIALECTCLQIVPPSLHPAGFQSCVENHFNRNLPFNRHPGKQYYDGWRQNLEQN